MGKICFAPGCKTGYVSDRLKNKKNGTKMASLFIAPKDPHLFEMWKKAVPRADKKLTANSHLCKLHFKEEDIELNYETKIFDGTVFRLARGRPLLKPTAIPSIFTNVPGHSTFGKNKKMKSSLCVKRKAISHPSMVQNKSKKSKPSSAPKVCQPKVHQPKAHQPKFQQPSDKGNKTVKKNNSSLQIGKENVLMEAIVLVPISEKSASTQSLFLKERQRAENVVNSSLSNSQKHVSSELQPTISPCIDSAPNVNLESHSNQNACNKILTESLSSDKVTNILFMKNSSIVTVIDSSMPDAITEKYSNENSSIRTITESMSDADTASNENSSIRTITQSVPAAVREKYSNKDSSIRNKIEFMPDAMTAKYFNENSSINTITESMSAAISEKYSNKSSFIRTITESIPATVSEKYSNENNSINTITDSPVPDAVSDYSDQSDYEKTLHELSSIKLTENNSDQNICDKDMSKTDNNLPDSEEEFSFEFLKANVNMFETTNSWWRVNTFDDFIVFSRWTSYYSVERRIVITKDLVVRVFLLDKETPIGCDIKELSFHHITKLIFRVENLRICSGIDNKDSNCVGYLQSKFTCKKYNLCLNCIQWRKDEKQRVVKLLRESTNCIELLNFNLIA